jgi:AcrR family transcriptional regulator
MDELAAEAGLTKPILYAHFGDRAGLATALGERFVAQLVERLASALAAPTPRELVRRAIDAFVGFVEGERNMYEFIVQESVQAARRESSSIARLRVFDVVGRAITAVLAQQLAQAGRDQSRAEPLAFAVMGTAFSGAEWWLDRQTLSRTELVDILTDLLWDGLEAQGLGQQRNQAAGADS